MSDASGLYLRVREKEGRLYDDDLVRQLPDVPPDHPFRREWDARAASCKTLVEYLGPSQHSSHLLELGCGNGWLAHKLSSVPGMQVWGLDLQSPELVQAARVFQNDNIAFLAADIFRAPFLPQTFDLIIVASAIQYFPDLPYLVRSLRELLLPTGELHILDSPLYKEDELAAARDRTRYYYAKLGFPEMADHYFHHTFAEISAFSPRGLYQPNSVKARLRRRLAGSERPFPWLCIGSGADPLVA